MQPFVVPAAAGCWQILTIFKDMIPKPELIENLRREIHRHLAPLITGDYVLLDLPYYANTGDTLIWEGELSFLGGLPLRMVGYGSSITWRFPELDRNTIILLQGGGGFGDLWRGSQEFRIRVAEAYPENPIIIFPQTVHYDDAALMAADAARMARHPDLTICARDRKSQGTLNQHFSNNILLVPDMAFCIPPERLEYKGIKKDRALMIRRTDKELAPDECPVPANADVRDWPALERTTFTTWIIYKLSGAVVHVPFLKRIFAAAADRIARNRLRNRNIDMGIDLLGPYDEIYTTRLHGAILAIMMGKNKIHIIDNSYGKNGSFYDTWLAGTQGVEMCGRKKP